MSASGHIDDGLAARPSRRRARVLLVQTQAENAGAQEISRLVGAGLVARGHLVHHLFFYDRTGGAPDLASVEFCTHERPHSPLALLRFVLAARRRIADWRPDVVFTFQHWGNTLGAPLVRAAGHAPVVANQVSSPALVPLVATLLDRLWGSLGLYRVITTNSDDTHAFYSTYPAAYRARLVRVPYGCEVKTGVLDRAAARAAFGLPPDAAVIGCAARLHPAKRLDCALRLLPRRPDLHLLLAGQGPARGELERLAAGLGVAERVRFLGELLPSRIGDFLAALDAFVFPSASETFGLAGLEAAVAGVPVIASDLRVLHEVLTWHDRPAALFVDPTDTAAFAAAVDRILADPALAADLAAAGRALHDRYRLDAMIDAYADLVDRVLAVAPPA